MRIFIYYLTLLVGIALCGTANSETDLQKYTLAVFPYLPIVNLEKIYAPMASDLGQALKKRVVFQSRNSFEEFRQEVESQTYDIIVVQPFDYVEIARNANYVPLARRDEMLSAIFVVAQNSEIKNVKDFAGKTIAMPPKPAAVSRLGTQFLLDNGLKVGTDYHVTYHKSHMSCMQQILIRKADACATAKQVLRLFNTKMKSTLKSIFQTRSIPHVLFAAHIRISEQDRRTLIETITSWDNDANKIQLLTGAELPAFVLAHDHEYDSVREIITRQQ